MRLPDKGVLAEFVGAEAVELDHLVPDVLRDFEETMPRFAEDTQKALDATYFTLRHRYFREHRGGRLWILECLYKLQVQEMEQQ